MHKRSASRGAARRALPILVAVLVAAALAGLAGCSPFPAPGTDDGPAAGPTSRPMAVDILVVDDPVGGQEVSNLACTVEATQLGVEGSEPVQIRVDWSASCGTHKSETFTFRGGRETFTSTYEDPTGQPLRMTFWATVRWTDSRGAHAVRSASAACS
jgi:hypothetical protein